MALKAGRVGVNPEDVDFMTGHVINRLNTTETIIGKWVDGSTLYRRAFALDDNVDLRGQDWVVATNNPALRNYNAIDGYVVTNDSSNNLKTLPCSIQFNDQGLRLLNCRNTTINTYTGSYAVIDYIIKNQALTLSLEED